MSGMDLQLPPGFRFHPTDEELVMHYLCRKCTGQTISVPIIAEVDLYKHEPWQLPSMALYGEKEWYFFSPRDRKYPNGSRPNRSAGMGYWKATGADKPIGVPKPVGIKKALVFYSGKAPKGEKTNWIMHEYRLADVDRSARKRNSLRLDDWVLCRIYNKKGGSDKHSPDRMSTASCSAAKQASAWPSQRAMKQEMQTLMPPPPLQRQQQQQQQVFSDYMYLDNSDSIVKPNPDSSCSEHVLSSPEFAYEREVQSRPTSWKTAVEASIGAAPPPLPLGSSDVGGAPFKDSLLQDILMYIQKPF